MARHLTITLEDEVAARVENEAQRIGVPPEDVISDSVRKLFGDSPAKQPPEPFKVRARDMKLRPGLSVDNFEALLDEVEGPWRR